MRRSFLLLFPLITMYFHEYHVALIDIRQKVDEERLEISLKLFIDDFEKAMILSGKVVRIGDELSTPEVKEAISTYILQHFRISVNGEDLDLSVLGSEWDDDLHSFYTYIECPLSQKKITELTLFDDIFTEVSAKQENMHYLHLGGREESVLLTTEKTSSTVKFK